MGGTFRRVGLLFYGSITALLVIIDLWTLTIGVYSIINLFLEEA